ncbi:hypothetical protein CROQUDRAFT_650027 [Cronartium quercuum f. sp. fusiforme G11]|uniref:Uncharacterized protein n=1 Tax=Cronartium quercuum f. sp. fusiforme G11 TaxID=708437 RepID=A0A9P6NYP7_9BASI|nr:hypothetical protein CROQUDRAFT_650027 [Cronartium quercuum f. sp. fusiforme G11]
MTDLNLLRTHPPSFTLNNLFKTQALHFNCSPHKTNFKSVSLQPSFVFVNFS